jgi:hypothetical protein
MTDEIVEAVFQIAKAEYKKRGHLYHVPLADVRIILECAVKFNNKILEGLKER